MKPSKFNNSLQEIIFFDLKFKTYPGVFTPYSGAQALVEEVIRLQPTSVLELGTGCGVMAISIAKNIEEVKILATDITQEALDLAQENALFHKVAGKIQFKKSDLLESVDTAAEVIVCNLPFVPSERIKYLQSEDKNTNLTDIDGGPDGFSLYRKLFLTMVQKNLYPQYLIAEIDYTHTFIAVTEAQKYFRRCEIDIKTNIKYKNKILIVKF